ncbi:hypothetical protein KFE25_006203 [Diacronema lutheri]|uniref:Pentacotripeptide-repeat region of PRORP domain-containing protein n=1 Tax=Diacronema lutheri TaxID=2081491 RepID=A0A8J6CJB7_DIALT|nr:hypothetical protein KFE25_006203 [Diacronema lutheri]
MFRVRGRLLCAVRSGLLARSAALSCARGTRNRAVRTFASAASALPARGAPPLDGAERSPAERELPPQLSAEELEAELRGAADAGAADALREHALAMVAELGDCESARTLSEAVVTSLVRERRAGEAWAAFDAARARGVQPTAGTFAAVVQACALTDEVERAESAIDAMAHTAHWPPPSACWENLLFAYAARADALGRLTREEKAALRRHNVPTARESVVAGALSALRRMSAEGVATSPSTQLGLLRVLAAAGQPRRAQAVLAALLHARAPLSESHFACAIDACGVAARAASGGLGAEEHLAEALGIVDALPSTLGAPPGERALRAMLRAYACAGRLNRALEWLARGYAAHGAAPTAECYGVAVRMCRETARPDVALEVLRAARARGIVLGASDGTAEQLAALAARWQLGSAVCGSATSSTRARAASSVLYELVDEMRHHPPLSRAADQVLARAELGASDRPQPRVLALRGAGRPVLGTRRTPGRARPRLRLAGRSAPRPVGLFARRRQHPG